MVVPIKRAVLESDGYWVRSFLEFSDILVIISTICDFAEGSYLLEVQVAIDIAEYDGAFSL